MSKYYIGVISDVTTGSTYKTKLATTKDRAWRLADDLVYNKNLDYANISVVAVNPMS